MQPPLSNRQIKARAKQAKEVAEKKRNPATYVNQTPFRYAERNFKSRTPPPDYSNVIYPSTTCPDRLASVELAHDLRTLSPYFGSTDPAWEQRAKQAYVLKELPGLIIIPNPFTPEAQRHLIQQCLSEYPQAPNTSNLHTHYDIPATGLWPLYEQEQNGTIPMDDAKYYIPKKRTDDNDDSDMDVQDQQRTLAIPLKACDDNFKADMDIVKPDPPAATTVPLLPASDLIRRLRWITLGYHYHWPSRTYHMDRRYPVPTVVASLVKSVVTAIENVGDPGQWINTYQGKDYQAEAGVVNYYQYKDTLMGHVDRSELNMDAPLISISLGNACIYLLGGTDRNTKPVALYLQSGDIIAMAKPCRRSFHGVPRIIENTLPDYLASDGEFADAPNWSLFGKYMATSRLNLNMRQVNTPTF